MEETREERRERRRAARRSVEIHRSSRLEKKDEAVSKDDSDIGKAEMDLQKLKQPIRQESIDEKKAKRKSKKKKEEKEDGEKKKEKKSKRGAEAEKRKSRKVKSKLEIQNSSEESLDQNNNNNNVENEKKIKKKRKDSKQGSSSSEINSSDGKVEKKERKKHHHHHHHSAAEEKNSKEKNDSTELENSKEKKKKKQNSESDSAHEKKLENENSEPEVQKLPSVSEKCVKKSEDPKVDEKLVIKEDNKNNNNASDHKKNNESIEVRQIEEKKEVVEEIQKQEQNNGDIKVDKSEESSKSNKEINEKIQTPKVEVEMKEENEKAKEEEEEQKVEKKESQKRSGRKVESEDNNAQRKSSTRSATEGDGDDDEDEEDGDDDEDEDVDDEDEDEDDNKEQHRVEEAKKVKSGSSEDNTQNTNIEVTEMKIKDDHVNVEVKHVEKQISNVGSNNNNNKKNEAEEELIKDIKMKEKKLEEYSNKLLELNKRLTLAQTTEKELQEKLADQNTKNKKSEKVIQTLQDQITQQEGEIARNSDYVKFLLSLLSIFDEDRDDSDEKGDDEDEDEIGLDEKTSVRIRKMIESKSKIDELETFRGYYLTIKNSTSKKHKDDSKKSKDNDNNNDDNDDGDDENDKNDEEGEDELQFSKPSSNLVSYDDKWTKCCSGGCFNFPRWWINPQYLLYIDSTVEVNISLSQSKREHIGFYVLEGNSYHKRSILKEEALDKCPFEDLQCVKKSFKLTASPDPYIVVPCNYDADITGSFSISVECKEKPIVFKKLVKSIDWITNVIEDSWSGKYAGGCRNYPTHMDNHQYLITSKYKTFVRLLLQFKNRENVDEIGIYVVNVEEENITAKLVNLHSANVVYKSGFNRPNEAVVSFTLQPNEKLVVFPSTFEPNKEAPYRLTFFSDHELSIRKLKEPKKLIIESSWEGNAMGGCLNHPSWRNNPQFALHTNHNVQIKLTQLNDLDTPHTIGFYILKSEGEKILEVTKENFITKANFTPSLSVFVNLEVSSPSTFTIIPCTFRPLKKSPFKLEVFANEEDVDMSLEFARSDWIESVVSGEWSGRSAGGCLNHHTWRNNDQIRLCAEKSGEVVLVLEQEASNDLKSIGFYITKPLPDYEKTFTDSPECILKKTPFKKNASLTCRFKVEAGVAYNIIPTTFAPLEVATYKIYAYGYQQTLEFHTIVEDAEVMSFRSIDGSWNDQSAGGCMKNQTWPKNPKFYILSSPHDQTPIDIVLEQRGASPNDKPHAVGISVCHCNEHGQPKINSVEDIIFSSNYEEARDIAISLLLPPSSTPFVITPSTFEANLMGDFTIHVYTSLSRPIVFTNSYQQIIELIEEAVTVEDQPSKLSFSDLLHDISSSSPSTSNSETDSTRSDDHHHDAQNNNNDNNDNNNDNHKLEEMKNDGGDKIKNENENEDDNNERNRNKNNESGGSIPLPPLPPPPPVPELFAIGNTPPLPTLSKSPAAFALKKTHSPSPSSTPRGLLSEIKKISLKDHALRPEATLKTNNLPEMTWTPFNIDKIVARRAFLEEMHDDDEEDTEEWYDDGDWE